VSDVPRQSVPDSSQRPRSLADIRAGGFDMARRHYTWRLSFAVFLTFGALTASALAQQTATHPSAATASGWTQGKTPDGQPDLQGMWLFFDPSPLETPGNPTRRRAGETRENAGVSDRLQREAAARRRAVRGESTSEAGLEADWHPTSPRRAS